MNNKANDMSFENRMSNWRDTVLSGGRGGSGGCCTDWAAKYVAGRNKREEALAISLEIIKPSSNLIRIDVNELDGWLVEAAVRSLVCFDQKQVLRFRYVFEYPNHFIKNRLRPQYPRINDASLSLIFGRAITNLKLVLEKLETPAKIRSYNLHARSVPRLEALAVPVGTPAPLEYQEALID